MEKKIKLLLIVAVCIGACYGIGQYRNSLKENIGISQEDTVYSENENCSEDEINEEIWSNISFEGVKKTEDNPWNFNAGIFNMDGEGKCILLTPSTAVTVVNLENVDKLSFQYEIHPQVKDVSDGAELLIWGLDKDNNIICEFNVEVDANSEWKKYELDLNEYADVIAVKIQCNNGRNGDDSGDWVIIKGNTEEDAVFGSNGYVKSATYFSNEWPINFWNSEMDDLSSDMEQIKNDGFDSIILVIPWREFQPTVSPITYNEYAFEKLDEVMRAAETVGLDVYTRIGYTWDFYNDTDENIVDRFCQLLGDNQTQNAWYDYVAKLYNYLSNYENFQNGFLTWEDFWNTLGVCDEPTEVGRIIKAKYIGYQEWIKDNYKLEEYNKKYGTSYKSYALLPVPARDEPAMEAMYEFYDNFLNTLLAKSQEVFKNLSMEVRMDWDVIYKTDGTTDYYKHVGTFSCENSDYTATMYGIPMGFENNGERVTYTEAMEKTEYILQQLKIQNGQKPVYVEQFIFADNTPKFKNNAQIKESDLNLYLENVADILLENTEGYGIWTYRNYRANMIYNSQFALEDEGWNSSGKVDFINDRSSNSCYLSENSMISQKIPDIRNHFDNDTYTFGFEVVDIDKEGIITVVIGDSKKEVEVKNIGKVEVEIPKGNSFDLVIESNDCSVEIDNLYLYSQIQQGYLYDENNNGLGCIEAIRVLNQKLMQ